MARSHKFGRETPSIATRKPIRVFVEPRLDRLVVVRTEPHEPRMVGRGVGYWRVGPVSKKGLSLDRITPGRDEDHLPFRVEFHSLPVLHLALRARARWWRDCRERNTWSVRYHRTRSVAAFRSRSQLACIAGLMSLPLIAWALVIIEALLQKQGVYKAVQDVWIPGTLLIVMFWGMALMLYWLSRRSRVGGYWSMNHWGVYVRFKAKHVYYLSWESIERVRRCDDGWMLDSPVQRSLFVPTEGAFHEPLQWCATEALLRGTPPEIERQTRHVRLVLVIGGTVIACAAPGMYIAYLGDEGLGMLVSGAFAEVLLGLPLLAGAAYITFSRRRARKQLKQHRCRTREQR